MAANGCLPCWHAAGATGAGMRQVFARLSVRKTVDTCSKPNAPQSPNVHPPPAGVYHDACVCVYVHVRVRA
jgi:hypothetical protein